MVLVSQTLPIMDTDTFLCELKVKRLPFLDENWLSISVTRVKHQLRNATLLLAARDLKMRGDLSLDKLETTWVGENYLRSQPRRSLSPRSSKHVNTSRPPKLLL